jgi:hypothetical protein
VVGVHRHPGDLGRVVEVPLDGQEPGDGPVHHRDQPGLGPDLGGGLGAAASLAKW